MPDHIADVIYGLDMFHMVGEPNSFLKECHRLMKKEGYLILDDGHQPRGEVRQKISASGLWKIAEEISDHLKCTPL